MQFEQAFDNLMRSEGGYVNNPRDPGGETNFGITIAVARAHGYTGAMRDLPITVARTIARKLYWDSIRADDLPCTLRYAVFDAAYHSGVSQSVKWLQRALGVVDDGAMGPKTLAAAQAADGHVLKAKMLGARLQFMTDLATWPSFGRGWARRVASLLVTP